MDEKVDPYPDEGQIVSEVKQALSDALGKFIEEPVTPQTEEQLSIAVDKILQQLCDNEMPVEHYSIGYEVVSTEIDEIINDLERLYREPISKGIQMELPFQKK